MKLQKLDKVRAWLGRNPYVLLVLLIGLALLALPGGQRTARSAAAPESAGEIPAPAFSVENEQERLRAVLESISGVGKAKVLLSVQSTAARNLAVSAGETVVISAGSGRQETVELSYDYPEYLGAVVVCQGAGSAGVRLAVCDAVAAFTGLGTHSIQVLKMD
jgi:stage III sporulation protein AG